MVWGGLCVARGGGLCVREGSRKAGVGRQAPRWAGGNREQGRARGRSGPANPGRAGREGTRAGERLHEHRLDAEAMDTVNERSTSDSLLNSTW